MERFGKRVGGISQSGKRTDPSISEKLTRIAFVKAFNEKRDDQWFEYGQIPDWVKKLVPRIDGKEFEDRVLRKKMQDATKVEPNT